MTVNKKKINILEIYNKAAQKLANMDSDEKARAVDPQGRIVINVDGTTVSYQSDETLNIAKEKLYKLELKKGIIDAYVKMPKGSLIALQQEFHFHLNLAIRTYKKISPDLNNQALISAHKKTMAEVNDLVFAAFAEGLEGAEKNGYEIDTGKLNKTLDKARKNIAAQAHQILKNNIEIETDFHFSNEDFKDIKSTAEKITATPNDLLHVDNDSRLLTWIEGSKHTSHHRMKSSDGKSNTATREIKTFKLIQDDVEPISRIQVRTPSLDVKKKISKKDCIDDIENKLSAVKNDYFSSLDETPNIPKAFIYNLYTSINDQLGDIKGNKQSQGADRILQGAHQYNKSQGYQGTYCFVQNIAVNGFGDKLGYRRGYLRDLLARFDFLSLFSSQRKLVHEATLMSEIALLHTLYDSSSNPQKDKITRVMDQYKNYLEQNDRPAYFSQSKEGEAAIEAIKKIKNDWKNEALAVNEPKNALKFMMARDLHFEHKYAKTIQALSVFCEKASIGGCKSGNERAQSINGRVGILDQHSKLPVKGNEKNYADKLKNWLDHEYNKSGLQGGASLISLADQGGPAKVQTLKGSRHFYTSRNCAEESASTMTNLYQGKASKMQAHKGLTKHMKEAWGDQNFINQLKSSPLKAVFGLFFIHKKQDEHKTQDLEQSSLVMNKETGASRNILEKLGGKVVCESKTLTTSKTNEKINCPGFKLNSTFLSEPIIERLGEKEGSNQEESTYSSARPGCH